MRPACLIAGPALLSCFLLGTRLAAQTTQVETQTEKLLRYARDACQRKWVIRRQAAKRLVKAGDAGLAAIETHLAKKGRSALSAELVDALGEFERDSARSLLASLVVDPSFYWRPQALQAMAKKPRTSETALFRANSNSRSYLLRRAALSGLFGIAKKSSPPELVQALRDEDLRIRVHAAGLLLRRKDPQGLPVLIGALLVEDSFFLVDYGRQLRKSAHQLLRTWAGTDLGYKANANATERRKAALLFHNRAVKVIGEFEFPLPAISGASTWILGFERRACKEGDLVLRLDSKGRLWRGLFNPRLLQTSKASILRLTKLASLAPDSGRRVHGKIRCDFTRLTGLGEKAEFSLRAAPFAMPEAAKTLVKCWEDLARAAGK